MKTGDTVITPNGREGRYLGIVRIPAPERGTSAERAAVSLVLSLPQPLRVTCLYDPADVGRVEEKR